MKCPNCEQELDLMPNNAFLNAEIYQRANRVVTNCCNTMIIIAPKITFDIYSYTGTNILEDDWGNTIIRKR